MSGDMRNLRVSVKFTSKSAELTSKSVKLTSKSGKLTSKRAYSSC